MLSCGDGIEMPWASNASLTLSSIANCTLEKSSLAHQNLAVKFTLFSPRLPTPTNGFGSFRIFLFLSARFKIISFASFKSSL